MIRVSQLKEKKVANQHFYKSFFLFLILDIGEMMLENLKLTCFFFIQIIRYIAVSTDD